MELSCCQNFQKTFLTAWAPESHQCFPPVCLLCFLKLFWLQFSIHFAIKGDCSLKKKKKTSGMVWESWWYLQRIEGLPGTLLEYFSFEESSSVCLLSVFKFETIPYLYGDNFSVLNLWIGEAWQTEHGANIPLRMAASPQRSWCTARTFRDRWYFLGTGVTSGLFSVCRLYMASSQAVRVLFQSSREMTNNDWREVIANSLCASFPSPLTGSAVHFLG